MHGAVIPQPILPMSPGKWLRLLRQQRGFTMKDVEAASTALARIYRNDEFRVSPSRLSEIENRDLTPSVHRLYALSAVYQVEYGDLLKRYGVDPQRAPQEFEHPLVHKRA